MELAPAPSSSVLNFSLIGKCLTQATLQQLANVVVQTARQDERLNAIERLVDRLEQLPAGHP